MSCGAEKPRRHEIGAVPILSRFGLERPDERPLPFGEHVASEVLLGDYRTAAPGWGRALQLVSQVPALALNFSFVALDPPEGGAWICALAAASSPGFAPCRIFTSNQIAEPALAAAGTTVFATRYDNREPAPAIAVRTGHAAAAVFAGQVLVAYLPRPIWWQGTALVIAGSAINEVLDVDLLLEVPFQGAKRVTG